MWRTYIFNTVGHKNIYTGFKNVEGATKDVLVRFSYVIKQFCSTVKLITKRLGLFNLVVFESTESLVVLQFQKYNSCSQQYERL